MIACVQCCRKYEPIRVGVALEEQFKDGKPYKLWMADRLRCPDCGHEVAITRESQEPVAEHYQASYAEQRARYAPKVIVR